MILEDKIITDSENIASNIEDKANNLKNKLDEASGYITINAKPLDGDTLIDDKGNSYRLKFDDTSDRELDTAESFNPQDVFSSKHKQGQISSVANAYGKSSSEVTPLDIKNYGLYEKQSLNSVLNNQEVQPFDKNKQYYINDGTENNISFSPVKIKLSDQKEYYGRNLATLTPEMEGVLKANNEYNISGNIVSDRPFGDYLGNSVETSNRLELDTNLLKSSAVKSLAGLALNILPQSAIDTLENKSRKEGSFSLKDLAQSSEVSDMYSGVSRADRSSINSSMYKASKDVDRGNYVSAVFDLLPQIDTMLAESAPQTATLIVGSMLGTPGVAIGTAMVAQDLTNQAVNDYKENNDGKDMPLSQKVKTFSGFVLSTLAEDVILGRMGSSLKKAGEALPSKLGYDTSKSLSKNAKENIIKLGNKYLNTVDNNKILKTIESTLTEGIQEYGENIWQGYMGRNENDTSSITKELTDTNNIVSGIAGGLMGGVMSGTTSAIGGLMPVSDTKTINTPDTKSYNNSNIDTSRVDQNNLLPTTTNDNGKTTTISLNEYGKLFNSLDHTKDDDDTITNEINLTLSQLQNKNNLKDNTTKRMLQGNLFNSLKKVQNKYGTGAINFFNSIGLTDQNIANYLSEELSNSPNFTFDSKEQVSNLLNTLGDRLISMGMNPKNVIKYQNNLNKQVQKTAKAVGNEISDDYYGKASRIIDSLDSGKPSVSVEKDLNGFDRMLSNQINKLNTFTSMIKDLINNPEKERTSSSYSTVNGTKKDIFLQRKNLLNSKDTQNLLTGIAHSIRDMRNIANELNTVYSKATSSILNNSLLDKANNSINDIVPLLDQLNISHSLSSNPVTDTQSTTTTNTQNNQAGEAVETQTNQTEQIIPTEANQATEAITEPLNTQVENIQNTNNIQPNNTSNDYIPDLQLPIDPNLVSNLNIDNKPKNRILSLKENIIKTILDSKLNDKNKRIKEINNLVSIDRLNSITNKKEMNSLLRKVIKYNTKLKADTKVSKPKTISKPKIKSTNKTELVSNKTKSTETKPIEKTKSVESKSTTNETETSKNKETKKIVNKDVSTDDEMSRQQEELDNGYYDSLEEVYGSNEEEFNYDNQEENIIEQSEDSSDNDSLAATENSVSNNIDNTTKEELERKNEAKKLTSNYENSVDTKINNFIKSINNLYNKFIKDNNIKSLKDNKELLNKFYEEITKLQEVKDIKYYTKSTILKSIDRLKLNKEDLVKVKYLMNNNIIIFREVLSENNKTFLDELSKKLISKKDNSFKNEYLGQLVHFINYIYTAINNNTFKIKNLDSISSNIEKLIFNKKEGKLTESEQEQLNYLSSVSSNLGIINNVISKLRKISDIESEVEENNKLLNSKEITNKDKINNKINNLYKQRAELYLKSFKEISFLKNSYTSTIINMSLKTNEGINYLSTIVKVRNKFSSLLTLFKVDDKHVQSIKESFNNFLNTKDITYAEQNINKTTELNKNINERQASTPAMALLFNNKKELNNNVLLAIRYALAKFISDYRVNTTDEENTGTDRVTVTGNDKVYITSASNLGNSILKILGLTENKKGKFGKYIALSNNLGQVAIEYAKYLGILKVGKVIKNKREVKIITLTDTEINKNGLEIKKEAITSLAKFYKDNKGTLDNTTFEFNLPSLTKINPRKIYKTKKSFNTKQASKEKTEFLNLSKKQGYKITKPIIEYLNKNRDTILKYLGFKQLEEIKTMSATERLSMIGTLIMPESFEDIITNGKNGTIYREFNQFLSILDIFKDNNMYFDYDFLSNGRFQIGNCIINPQVNKLFRGLSTLKDSEVEVDINNKDHMKCFYNALAFAFDSMSTTDNNTNFGKTLLKIGYKKLKESLDKGTLESDTFTITDNNKEKEITLGVEHISYAIKAIQTIKNYEDSIKNNKSTFTCTMTVEQDATASGFCNTMLAAGCTDESLLSAIGINKFTRENLLANVNSKEKSDIIGYIKANGSFLLKKINQVVKDIYQLVAQNTKVSSYSTLNEFTRNNIISKETYESLTQLLPVATKGEKISKALRTLMKKPSQVFGYSAGKKTILSRLNDVIVDKLVSDFYNSKSSNGKISDYDKALNNVFIDLFSKMGEDKFKELLDIHKINYSTEKNAKILNIETIKQILKVEPLENIKIKIKDEKLNDYEMVSVDEILKNILTESYSNNIVDYLTKTFKPIQDYNATINTTSKVFSDIFLNIQKIIVNNLSKESKLTTEQFNELYKTFISIVPSLTTSSSSNEKDSLLLLKQNGLFEQILGANTTIRDKTDNNTAIVGAIEVSSEAGASASPKLAHDTDGHILARTMLDNKSISYIPIHDAIVTNIFNSTVAKDYNNNVLLTGIGTNDSSAYSGTNSCLNMLNQLRIMIEKGSKIKNNKFPSLINDNNKINIEEFKNFIYKTLYDKYKSNDENLNNSVKFEDIIGLDKDYFESNFITAKKEQRKVSITLNDLYNYITNSLSKQIENKNKLRQNIITTDNMAMGSESVNITDFSDIINNINKETDEDTSDSKIETINNNQYGSSPEELFASALLSDDYCRAYGITDKNSISITDNALIRTREESVTNTNSALKLLESIFTTTQENVSDNQKSILRDTLSRLGLERLKGIPIYFNNVINYGLNKGFTDTLHRTITVNTATRVKFNGVIRALENFEASTGEIYVHEITHAVTVDVLKRSLAYDAVSTVRKLEKLFRLAKLNIKPEDLIPPTVTKNASSMFQAQKLYDYMFNNAKDDPTGVTNNTTEGLSEFVALASTNEHFRNVLNKIKIKESKTNESLFEKVIAIAKNIFNVFTGSKTFTDAFPTLDSLLSGTKLNSDQENLLVSVDELITNISNASYRGTAKITGRMRILERTYQMFVNIKGYSSRKTALFFNKIFNIGDKFKFDYNYFNKESDSLLYNTYRLVKFFGLGVISKSYRENIRTMFTIMGLSDTSSLKYLASSLFNPSEYKTGLERLSQTTRTMEKNAKDKEAIILGVLNELFPKITNKQNKSLLNIGLRTDLQSLDVTKYSIDTIKQLLSNSKIREQEIKVLRDKLHAKLTNESQRNLLNGLATSLAYYMITGKGNEALRLNAKSIIKELDINLLGDNEFISNLDSLITISSFNYLNADEVKEFNSLDSNSIKGFINCARYQKEQAIKVNDSDLSYIKGYTKNIKTDYNHKYTIGKLTDTIYYNNKGYTLVKKMNSKYGIYKSSFTSDQTIRNAAFMFHTEDNMGFLTKEIERGTIDKDGFKLDTTNSKISDMIRTIMKKNSNLSIEQINKLSRGYYPIVGTNGIESGYRMNISNEDKELVLQTNTNGIEILSKMYADNEYKSGTKRINKNILNYIFEDMNKHKKDINSLDIVKSSQYVEISDTSKDAYAQQLYQILPKETKKLIKDNGQSLYVKREAILTLFGSRDFSLSNLNIFKNHSEIKKSIVIGETILKDIASLAKNNIVIKIPSVLWNNIVSNLFTSVLLGRNLITTIKKSLRAVSDTKDYVETYKQLIKINTKINLGIATKKEVAQVNLLELELRNNPVDALMIAGEWKTIVEDINSTDIISFNKIGNMISKKLHFKVPSLVAGLIKNTYLTEDTAFYKFMYTATQYSDFVSRVAEYEFAMESAPDINKDTKEYKKYKTKVLDNIRDLYVNYDKPMASGLQYLNDIGLLMFTKYMLGVQPVIFNIIRKHTLGVGAFLFAQHYFDTSDVLETVISPSVIKNRLSNPLENLLNIAVPMPLQHMLGI